MTQNSGAGNLIDAASSGVQDLAKVATSALGQGGPAGALAQPVADVLRNVWEGYFGSPIPPGGTNWNAYTHEQLYQMLWHNADVGDVSSVAAEWGRHGSELSEHGNALREQRGALSSSWTGKAAEPAKNRLEEIGRRSHGTASRAATVQQATQHASDALAVARNTMPPPPGDPIGLVLSGATAGAGVGAVIGGALGAAAGGVGAAPGALMGAAVGAVAGGGASMFLAFVGAAEQKAEAVHVMQRYEASLQDSSQAIAPTADPAGGDGQTVASGYPGDGLSGRGVPWNQLAASAPTGSALPAGPRTGAFSGALLAESSPWSRLTTTGSRTVGTGMGSGAGARRDHGEEDEEHRNRMPTIDHRLFAVEDRATDPVIGL